MAPQKRTKTGDPWKFGQFFNLEKFSMNDAFPTSNDPRLGKGSLWAALPIPACKALTYAGYGSARDVLVALIMHSDGRSPYVFPSRKTIEKFSNVGSNSLTEIFGVLEKFGFIRIDSIKKGKTKRNRYEILRACWHWDEFNDYAKRFRQPVGGCKGCWKLVYMGDTVKTHRDSKGFDVPFRFHKECGGQVVDLKKEDFKQIREGEKQRGM